jgi:hypothetical protein
MSMTPSKIEDCLIARNKERRDGTGTCKVSLTQPVREYAGALLQLG